MESSKNYKYGLLNINIDNYYENSIQKIANDFAIDINSDEEYIRFLENSIKLQIESQVKTSIEVDKKKNKIVDLILNIDFKISKDSVERNILGIGSRLRFEVNTGEENETSIPLPLLETFASITISTTRGLLFGMIKNKYNNYFVLPLFTHEEVKNIFGINKELKA